MLMPSVKPLGELENASEFIARHIGIQPGENYRALLEVLRHALLDDHLPHETRNGSCLFPVDGLGVWLASRSRRCTECMDHEEGVFGEEGDEALTDGACRTEDANLEFPGFDHVGMWSVQF